MINRRSFLLGSVAAGSFPLISTAASRAAAANELSLPLTDFHVHLDNSTIDKVLELSVERKVHFGIVEHAGTKENVYPTVLSNDDELNAYIAMLDGKPVYKGVQAEWTDWMGCFSRETLAKLDYIITDAMTMPDQSGKRMKLWEPTEPLGDAQSFMDRYVDWHVQTMEHEPIDIFVNLTWLPAPFAGEYDTLWTEKRMRAIIDSAVKHGIAIEISSSFLVPKRIFLEQAKAAGLKFAFGSNGRHPKMGLLDYSLNMAEKLNLTPKDMFVPGSHETKAAVRRNY